MNSLLTPCIPRGLHVFYWGKLENFRTDTESRRDADAEQVLQHNKPCGEAAVFWPHLSNGLPPSPGQNNHQSAGMQQRIEIHPLPNHVDRHDEAHLRNALMLRQSASDMFTCMWPNKHVPPVQICRSRSWWSTWCRAGCRDPGAASWCPGRWCWRAEPSGCCADGSRAGGDEQLPQMPATPAPSDGSRTSQHFNWDKLQTQIWEDLQPGCFCFQALTTKSHSRNRNSIHIP